MGTHRSWSSLYKAQVRRFERTVLAIDNVTKILAEEGEKDLRASTSGGIKSKELARMGHPYGRGAAAAANLVNAGNVGRRGTVKKRHRVKTRAKAPLRPINKQSHKLYNSIKKPSKVKKATYDVGIGAGVKYARYILHPAGTKYMVGRGVMGWREINKAFPMGEVEKRHRIRIKAYRDVVRRAQRS